MKRNTILYILIALLVVVGGAWYALSTRVDGELENDRTEETEEGLTEENEGTDTDNEAEGSTATNGESGQTGSTQDEATSGTPAEDSNDVDAGSSDSQSSTNESTGSDSVSEPEYGVGGSEITTISKKQLIRTELNAQLVLLDSVVQLVSLQLETGDLSNEEAGQLLDQVGGTLDELEKAVELFLAL